jgi:hypothetical protein
MGRSGCRMARPPLLGPPHQVPVRGRGRALEGGVPRLGSPTYLPIQASRHPGGARSRFPRFLGESPAPVRGSTAPDRSCPVAAAACRRRAGARAPGTLVGIRGNGKCILQGELSLGETLSPQSMKGAFKFPDSSTR